MAKRSKKKWIVRLALLAVAAALCAVGWDALRPLVMAETTPVYAQYTVEVGDIETSMSLSGAIELVDSESFSASERTTVQEVYVEADQEVSAGDELLRLNNGETFTATIDGTVTTLNVARGDAVWPQMSLVTVADLSDLRVSTSVDEYDVRTVAAGQRCEVTVVSLGLTFETEIDHVDRVSASTGAVASYTVTADIDAPENVLPGMQATVTIPRESVSGVNMLPMAALTFDEDGAPCVLVDDGAGGYAQVAVETGLSDGMYVEITSGVAAGDTVYVQTGTQSVESRLSLQNLYKSLFGEKTVVNDRTGGAGGFGGGMELPEGMEMPEGMELPEDMEASDGAQTPAAPAASAEAAETAADAEAPEAAEASEAAEAPDSTAAPQGFEAPEGMELPEGMEMPEGFEPSSGMPSFGGQSGAPPATESGDLEGGTDDAQ